MFISLQFQKENSMLFQIFTFQTSLTYLGLDLCFESFRM